MSERGLHIVIEGDNGVGKSTAADITARHLVEIGFPALRHDEPSSIKSLDGEILVPVAVPIREILLNDTLSDEERKSKFHEILDSDDLVVSPRNEYRLLEILQRNEFPLSWRDDFTLFDISRAENWHQLGKIALASGVSLVKARSHISSHVFQGYVGGVDYDLIATQTLRSTDEDYLKPDLEVILNIDDEEKLRRLNARRPSADPDKFEKKGPAFEQRVREGYSWLAERNNIEIVSAMGTPEEVAERVWQRVVPLLVNLK